METALLVKQDLFKLIKEGKKVTFISAPSGYGKTTTMKLWLEHTGFSAIFISLSETDDDSVSYKNKITQISESLNKNSLIILDDFHMITSEKCIKLTIDFINRLPVGKRVVILSRTPPPFRFESYRLKGLMTLIDSDSLRFTSDEIIYLAKKNGETLTPSEAAFAHGLTDGWPIAVHSWLHGKDRASSKERELIFKFFEDVFFSDLSNEVKKNILLSCVVDILNPSLFTALTGEEDSEQILTDICGKNAFFSRVHISSFRFHSLFREFLHEKLNAAGFSVREQYIKAARWYEENELPYMAVKNYVLAEAWEEMTKPLYALFARTGSNNSVEEHYYNIKALGLSAFPDEVMGRHILLLETRAWGYYLGGEAKRLSHDIDILKELLTKTDDINSWNTAVLFLAVDQRKPLSRIIDELYHSKWEFGLLAMAHTASINQNLPFLHRSYRDHSDFAIDMENTFEKMRMTLGRLLGKEFTVIENCIKAGIFYEQGKLETAFEYATIAISEIPEGIPFESAFCAYMISAAILYAMNKNKAADEIIKGLSESIENSENDYLLANLQAFIVKRKLALNDKKAATDWLNCELSGINDEKLFFYKNYCYLTTARALILHGKANTAISFLEKLLSLSKDYNRTLDIVEVLIYLSIAYRKKKLPREAEETLVEALEIAQEYGFTQLFINESLELAAELGRLSHRLFQPYLKERLVASFVKGIYITAVRHSRKEENAIKQNPRLSKRQLELIRLLATGCSYQEIAEESGVKMSTVKTYLRAAYHKLGAVNRQEAVEKAVTFGLVKNYF